MGDSIQFVTGNAQKLKEVQMILGPSLNVSASRIDLPELQGDGMDIIREKCKLAAAEIQGPVIVEDTMLCFKALGGLPGPYIKWFLDKLGHLGLNKLLVGFDTNAAWAQCNAAFTEGPGRNVVVFAGVTQGSIVLPRGSTEFGWDPIFQPEGLSTTYAEMPREEKNMISHRFRAFEQLSKFLHGRQARRAGTMQG